MVQTGLGERAAERDIGAVSSDATSIPIIDLSLPEAEVVESMRKACCDIGFFYLAGHGVPSELVQATFGQAARFFELGTDEKMKIDIHKSANMKGYTKMLGENVDPANRGDMHEAFDIGNETGSFEGHVGEANQWPSNLEGFRAVVTDYWTAVRGLALRLFPIFAQALGLDRHFFDHAITDPSLFMRLLHYPAQTGPVDERMIGIGAHTDYEIFTILAQQDDVQALQILGKDGRWIHATPKPGCFVVNLGDLTQRWTSMVDDDGPVNTPEILPADDKFVSTMHRAINRSGRERYSIPMFCSVDPQTVIEPLPTCVSEAQPAKYPKIKAGEYIESRLRETYAASAPVEAASA